MSAKVILLSGPSCAGKTPLVKSFIEQNPYIKIGNPVLYTSRESRPNETDGIDYYFRSEKEIKKLNPAQFIVRRTRHIWQAINIQEFFRLTEANELVIFDIHPNLVDGMMGHEGVVQHSGQRLVRVFLQPATIDELEEIKSAMGAKTMREVAEAIMTIKLISRAQQHGKELTNDVMYDIQQRASRAWEEIQIGQDYEHIIINHDGEDSTHWKDSPPTGEAGQTLKTFTKIIKNIK